MKVADADLIKGPPTKGAQMYSGKSNIRTLPVNASGGEHGTATHHPRVTCRAAPRIRANRDSRAGP